LNSYPPGYVSGCFKGAEHLIEIKTIEKALSGLGLLDA